MITLIYFCLVIGLIYFGITLILPKIISYLLIRKFNVKIRCGRISLPFSLRDVNICKSGFSVQIDEICIRSSFFNSEVTKLLSINIRDVRINKDINKKSTSSQSNDQNNSRGDDGKNKGKIVDFRDKKVPPSIIKFAQFMAVHMNNISLILMDNNFEPGWMLHATVKELHLDGSIVHSTKTLLVSASLCDVQAKVLRHSPVNKQIKAPRPCLAEFAFGISLDGVLVAHGPISLEKLQLSMIRTKVTVHGGLYDFIKDAKMEKEMIQNYIDEEIQEVSETSSDTYQRISPIIPKNFLVKIENTTISAVKENSSNDFSAMLHLLTISGKFSSRDIKEECSLPVFYSGIQIQQLEIDTIFEKLLYLEQFSIESKLEDDSINIYAKLYSFVLNYNHQEIYEWYKINFMTDTPINSSKSLVLIERRQRNRGILEKILKNVVITGCAEFWNVTGVFKLGHQQMSSISCTHMKVILEQFSETRSNVYKSHWMNVLLNKRHWVGEWVVDSFWWSLGTASALKDSTQNLKKNHIRGSPFYVGVSLIKLSSYGDSTKLDFSIHTLRTEYSSHLAEFLVQGLERLRDYSSNYRPKSVQIIQSVAEQKSTKSGLLINAKINDITCFFFNQFDRCMLLNLNEISLAKNQSVNVLKMDNFQTALIDFKNKSGSDYITDITNIFINVKVIRIEYSIQEKVRKIAVFLLQEAIAIWNTNLHMHLFTLFNEIKDLKSILKPDSGQSMQQVQNEDGKGLILDLYAEGNTELGIKISERHSMQVSLENLYVNRKDRFSISVETIFINIDDMHIFTFKDVDIQSLKELGLLKTERSNYDGFKPTNKVWATTIGGMKVFFPYDHDFYDAVQNELVSISKWLKIVHGIKKKPFTSDSPLPSDMIIQIKDFLMEMSDDPFEVKLRDNYVLLLDEYNESLKRKQLFDQKIAQLCSDRLLLPAATLEELNASLIKKNSEIYIQRSKEISELGPARTRLIAWILTDLEIMAMADPSIHGTDNVMRMMGEIDPESPWPDEGLEFTTLWCRAVNVSCTEWKFMLRDYPQPMFHVERMHLFGHLCGAEQVPPRRAKRDVDIEIGEPFGTHTIERGMTALKFYHDFNWELENLVYAFGPCWEPVIAQCNLSFEKISAPSRDPSPVLPFWDKMRLIYHGRLAMIAKKYTILLHASLDPYNTTEEMELTWNNCEIFWTNAKIMYRGELNVSVRTASRYDDCRLLHLPSLKLTFKLNWICLANPNDHHSVIPCAPDKLPEYSSNQVHDSFRAFRSQNLNIWISFETKHAQNSDSMIDIPNLVLYGSTLRWFESLKLILSGVTRPTRRGPVFNNVRPRKKQLSRHYRKAHLQMSLHKFQVYYWMSHALNRGFQLNGGRITFSSEHTLTLSPIDDGLIHRSRADWAIMYMNCELNDAEIWLRTTTFTGRNDSAENISTSNGDQCRDYFLSVAKVSYGREALLSTNGNERQKDTPTHKLVVYDLKGAWTKNNRDVAFALFDSFMKSQRLKDNLTTEALKWFRKEGSSTPLKSRNNNKNVNDAAAQLIQSTVSVSTAHVNKHQQTSDGIAMLQQLIAESDHKSVVFSDDMSTQPRQQLLTGLQACQDGDVSHYNWFISLVNSQVLMKGCETSGYVILSAAKAEILQRVHRPVWRDHTLVSKTTWVGSLECMQYYATVSADDGDPREMAEIMWLTVDNIQEKDKDATVINEFPDLPHLVGSGQSVGGVVSETVGVSDCQSGEKPPVQLQRIVSRCKCEFFYVSYGDTSIDQSMIMEAPPPPNDDTISPWEKQDEPVDAFTLMHHDLDVCTNSLQYAMILDIVNNLLLYVEPQRKQALERLARMRFQLQLYSSEDQKRPIQHLQTQIRSLMSKIRSLEKDIHFIGKARLEEGDTAELRDEYEEVQKLIRECKEDLSTQSDELDMMLSCYKETQLNASNKLQTRKENNKPVNIVRANEICFKHAQWRLTEADGQIGIADLILSNFLYTKNSKSDDSVEHLLELGYIRISNLIPRDSYKEVLCPTEIQRDMPVDHKRVLRVFCREKPPVGGISVKEHFEINVVPITIAISKKFYSTMLKFCFPDRDTSEAEGADDLDDNASGSSSSSHATKYSAKKSKSKKSEKKDSNFYVKIQDDVEKMKERAEKNKLFIYIKIPEVPVRVSYKGNKEKNLEDITDLSLLIPTLEYHNVTWTWLDLLLAMKSDSRRVLLSQAIKQKLKIRSKLALVDEQPSPQEEDKAKMLFGNRHAAENKSLRKGVFKIKKP